MRLLKCIHSGEDKVTLLLLKFKLKALLLPPFPWLVVKDNKGRQGKENRKRKKRQKEEGRLEVYSYAVVKPFWEQYNS